jgi:hypothetical protein
LIHQIRPGLPVQIQSKEISGTFRVAQTLVKGDTWGDDWNMALTLDKPGIAL